MLLLITFGSGPKKYSDRNPSHFNFTTDYKQHVGWKISQEQFAFVNRIPNGFSQGHKGAYDHTLNDGCGYMYLVNLGSKKKLIVNVTINNLSIGMRYEYSAYLANIAKTGAKFSKNPKICFEVRDAMSFKKVLGKFSTNKIPKYDKLTWEKYKVPFMAKTNAVILLMKSLVEDDAGNDVVIDDIELRACSNDTSQYHDTS